MTRQELLEVAKPILFNTEMVRAILDGRKSVTRRVIKQVPNYYHREYKTGKNKGQPRRIMDWDLSSVYEDDGVFYLDVQTDVDDNSHEKIESPYQVGNILYVRETWRLQNFGYDSTTKEYDRQSLEYRADLSDIENEMYGRRGGCAPCKWKPSIHMPKEAARIFLRVTDVRVERLQEITIEDCHNEGINESGVANFGSHYNPQKYDFSVEKFETLWNSTVKKSDLYRYDWSADPWVWVIEFEVIEPKNEQ